jgi:peptidyl-dipeptidase Dcp
MSSLTLNDITIRTTLQPGDIGYVVYLHGHLYSREYNYGLSFETYVAEGLVEFYGQYDAMRDRVWIAEHNGKMVGFLLLMHRGEAAQLRYYVLEPAYRGIGLGKKLMGLFMAFLQEVGYTAAYLWTTSELPAAASMYKKNGFALVEERPATAPFEKNVTEQKYEWRREA